MVTSYIKGATECIFTHIHLERRGGLEYIHSPLYFILQIMTNPCGTTVMEESSFMRLRVQYRLLLLSLKFEITDHVRQDEEVII